jgi:hypothetical protein
VPNQSEHIRADDRDTSNGSWILAATPDNWGPPKRGPNDEGKPVQIVEQIAMSLQGAQVGSKTREVRRHNEAAITRKLQVSNAASRALRILTRNGSVAIELVAAVPQ